MEEGYGFFDVWLKTQKQLLDNWTDATKNIQRSFLDIASSKEDEEEGSQGMFSLYNSWTRTVGKSFDEIIKNYPMGIGKDTFSKLFSGADAYMKLYEFWAPLSKAFEERTFDPDSYKDFLDPAKYKEVIDKVFGFSSPQTITEFYGQTAKSIETWGSSAQNFVKPWVDAIQKNVSAAPDLATGKVDSSMNMFHNLYTAFESTFGKAMKMPSVGKDREKIDLLMQTLDMYSEYMAKNTEFQHKMYVTGQKAMEKVAEAIAKKIKDGTEVKNYDEFFKLWTDMNEDEYFELFKSSEFSELQGELLETALDTRKNFHKVVELYLEDFPIAVRSEVDDLYKTVNELKKKVRSLEKKL